MPRMTLENALPYIRSNNSILSNLDLSQSLLERDELQELEQALGHPFCRTLLSLEMRGCAMSDEGAAALFRGLAKNYSVTRLDLTNSTLGPFGVRALADALASTRRRGPETRRKTPCWRGGTSSERHRRQCRGQGRYVMVR